MEVCLKGSSHPIQCSLKIISLPCKLNTIDKNSSFLYKLVAMALQPIPLSRKSSLNCRFVYIPVLSHLLIFPRPRQGPRTTKTQPLPSSLSFFSYLPIVPQPPSVTQTPSVKVSKGSTICLKKPILVYFLIRFSQLSSSRAVQPPRSIKRHHHHHLSSPQELTNFPSNYIKKKIRSILLTTTSPLFPQ